MLKKLLISLFLLLDIIISASVGAGLANAASAQSDMAGKKSCTHHLTVSPSTVHEEGDRPVTFVINGCKVPLNETFNVFDDFGPNSCDIVSDTISENGTILTSSESFFHPNIPTQIIADGEGRLNFAITVVGCDEGTYHITIRSTAPNAWHTGTHIKIKTA